MTDPDPDAFFTTIEGAISRIAKARGFAFSKGPLHRSQGAGRLFALNGPLYGPHDEKHFALVVWARESWAAFEQCHLWWYFGRSPVLPHRPPGRPQYTEIARGSGELERIVPERLRWAAGHSLADVWLGAMTGRLLTPSRIAAMSGGAEPWDPPEEDP